MSPAAGRPVVMRASAVAKVYGGTHALKGVDFSVRAGAVTALFGENGAGKSTLMKILAGVEQPSTGTIELDGEPVAFRSAADAVAHGVAIIHQELNLCPNLSVTDNVFLGRERTGRGGLVSSRAQRQATAALLERLEEPIDPDALVGDLRLGQQQIVEIARAISLDARVLIMDEPTSALSASEVEVLFRVIHELTGNGVAVVYISHHLEEALEIADDVAVLRDGALVATGRAAEVDLAWIVANMVGRSPDDLYPRLELPAGDPVLEIEGLSVVDPTNPARLAVEELSLTVRAGQIVCLYGLMGAGRTELLEALAGRLPARAGTVRVDGRDVTGASVGERIGLGLVLVPEDRQRDGLVQTMSVGDNLSLASIGRFLFGPFVAGRRESAAIDRVSADVTVKAAGPTAPITSLSGGNQQKVVIGKALLTEPRALLLDEPTRGIDVGAKADIFALMAEQARRGVAVLFATSELSEALNAATHVVVMYRGRVMQLLDPATTSKEQLMAVSGEAEPTPPANGATA
ncbi:sugar ABC transporter ATP-binding protein [Phytohabitans sp. ZYX-F-186]|uniref:Sugar ABC transporter ATP-binding protein n=1 Tax=Phytohabitans maris TaxID=3071409 RepID=A0ABU0ZPG8_9ACTN|nr:sugar ABC transporter ATP-binding protein [Phytohabitans sp. ZYX-F-186]MDQ7908297.1 sugar ABC transporter ATP-binding protein [Phytohabitans sp. ZYX-F-186]